jgi:hypothetical protein
MLIKDLEKDYPLVHKAAMRNVCAQGYDDITSTPAVSTRDPDYEHLSEAFNWHKTPEGFLFWLRVSRGRFEQAKALHTELFESPKLTEVVFIISPWDVMFVEDKGNPSFTINNNSNNSLKVIEQEDGYFIPVNKTKL